MNPQSGPKESRANVWQTFWVTVEVLWGSQRPPGFYCGKTYSVGLAVPQNEVTDSNGATTREVRKTELVKTKRGWKRNDQGEPKMSPKG